MSRRSLLVLFSLLAVSAAGLAAGARSSRFHLWRAERLLAGIYQENRPLPYRWIGAPASHSSNTTCDFPIDVTAVQDQIKSAESVAGKSERSLKLTGRWNLLKGRFETAHDAYSAALRMEPGNTEVRLELAIVRAMRAKCESRPLDYEYAMEELLALRKRSQAPEIAYDLAIVFRQAGLPRAARSEFSVAMSGEWDKKWRIEDHDGQRNVDELLKSWDRRWSEETASPESYLAHADMARSHVEVVMTEAMQNWLPRYFTDGAAHRALDRLAHDMLRDHQDPWLLDLLHIENSPASRQAIDELSATIRDNNIGHHIAAISHAGKAESIFSRLGNAAGELRARHEAAYSLDRQWKHRECLAKLQGLRQKTSRRRYQWITGQVWLEEITCATESRRSEVIQPREEAYNWIRNTGYEGLRLRAASFLTEHEVSADRRLLIWSYGFDGLQSFWKGPMPYNRGYTFYYTLGSSALGAGHTRVALVLLEEGLETLKRTPYRQLYALALSDLGAWRFKQKLRDKAGEAFAEMDKIFDSEPPEEIRKFRRLAEVTRASLDLDANRPQAGRDRIVNALRGIKFPYRDLSPTERRAILPVLGKAFLKNHDFDQAEKIYLRLISENRAGFRTIHDRAQRDNLQREIGPAWRGLVQTYLETGRQEKALAAWEAFRGGRINDPALKPVIAPQGAVLLTYAFLPQGLSAWVTGPAGPRHLWLDKPEEISQDAADFSALASDPQSNNEQINQLSRLLYSELIQPFRNEIPADSVLVIDADGALGGLPWAALEDQTGAALIDQFAFCQVVGWAEAQHFLYGKPLDFSKGLIFADPQLGSDVQRDYPPLTDALLVAQWLQRRYPSAVVRKNDEATATALLELIRQSTWLHYGGHGVSNGGFGELLLAPLPGERSWAQFDAVTASHISRLDLSNLQFAFLATCSGAIGEREGGVNLDGLVRAFLEAGTRSVVAARWNVRSAETTEMVRVFYETVAKGKRPAEALRQAARIVRRNSRTAHPYYWAGFQVFGAP